MSRKKASFNKKFESFDGDLTLFDDHSDENMVVFDSWLYKKGKVNTKFKRRWCVIYTDRKLAYFLKESDKKPCGYIILSNVDSINIYIPQNNPSLIQSHSEEDENKAMDPNQIRKQHFRSISFTIKTASPKGADINDFGFELVTKKRTWVFTTSEHHIYEKWLFYLRDLAFGKPLHSGSLWKIGEKYRTWRRRHFIIYDQNEIRYFTNDQLDEQKGKIDLKNVYKINATKPNQYHYSNCIELHTKERIWCLAAETKQERDIWMNGIKSIMKKHQRTFVPSAAGSLSLYNSSTGYWQKYYFAVDKNSMENRLCLFENQIDCKQLQAVTCYGDEQFNLICKTKIKKIISLSLLIDVFSITSFEFKMTNENCKADMSDMKCIFTVKLENSQFYFAPHPNKPKEVQKWINIIRNLRSSQRQNIYSKLVKAGYKPSYIRAALEQYESSYGTKQYDFMEIKGQIDRMAKPESGVPKRSTSKSKSHSRSKSLSKSDKSSDSKSASSPIISRPAPPPNMVNIDIRTIQEDKSLTFESHHNNQRHTPRRSSITYNKNLNDANYVYWSKTEVLIWFKALENGLICQQYPDILKGLDALNITGAKLKQLNEMNFQQLGVKDELHRALILKAIHGLKQSK